LVGFKLHYGVEKSKPEGKATFRFGSTAKYPQFGFLCFVSRIRQLTDEM